MKRRHVYIGASGVAIAFLVIAVLRLLVDNGLLWHFWHHAGALLPQ